MAAPIIPPRRPEEFFNEDGTFTLRALRFFEDLTGNTNVNTQDIEDDSGIGALNALVLRLQAQVGSGKPLTIDTTGFTVDTTFQFTDQTEA
jgi:hypothetical protein